MARKSNFPYKPNHNSYALYYHVVLITEGRMPLIDQPMMQFLREFFAFKCQEMEVRLLEQWILSAHAHLLLSLRPAHDLPQVINYLKGTAAHEANHHYNFANKLDWMRGYHIDSVSPLNLDKARSYLKQQYDFHPDQIPRQPSDKKVELQWKLDERHKANDLTYALYYHVVWSTPKHDILIDQPMADFLLHFFPTKCKELEVQLLAHNVLADHAHLELHLRPWHHIPVIINRLKGAASYETNNNHQFSTHLSWGRGYYIDTVSKPSVEAVQTYIQNQYQHHPDKIPKPPTH